MEKFYDLLALLLDHKVTNELADEYLEALCSRLGFNGTPEERAEKFRVWISSIVSEQVQNHMREQRQHEFEAAKQQIEEQVRQEFNTKYQKPER